MKRIILVCVIGLFIFSGCTLKGFNLKVDEADTGKTTEKVEDK